MYNKKRMGESQPCCSIVAATGREHSGSRVRNRGIRTMLGFVLLMASFSLFADPGVVQMTGGAMALASPPAAPGSPDVVSVSVNKSRVVKLVEPVSRVSVANPDIADILVLNARELYIVGKRLGTTNVVLWDKKKRVQRVLGLEVSHDLSTLKEKMYRYLPGEDIRIESAQDTIVLSGEVSSVQKMGAALDLARTFAVGEKEGEEKVLNLMQVGGAQQVMLEVKVAEINRTLVRRLDIDFNYFKAGSSFKFGAVNGGASFPDAVLKDPILGEGRIPQWFDRGTWGPAIPEVGFNPMSIEDTGMFLQYLGGSYLFEMVVDAAKNNGLAKILAEPNLTTLSGQEAKFLSGGEFPIPVPNDDGITIDYKEYGVGVTFVPVVLDSGLISLKVNVGVSELRFDNSANIGFAPGTSLTSFFVPALAKRAANATVEVPSGQTLAIAGLINENLRESVDKFPGLGDLPVLGSLFRSQEFVKGETELVIFVTPRLARPFSPELAKLPTDDFVEPSEAEFYLMGRLEGAPSATEGLGPDKTGAEGKFGHEL